MKYILISCVLALQADSDNVSQMTQKTIAPSAKHIATPYGTVTTSSLQNFSYTVQTGFSYGDLGTISTKEMFTRLINADKNTLALACLSSIVFLAINPVYTTQPHSGWSAIMQAIQTLENIYHLQPMLSYQLGLIQTTYITQPIQIGISCFPIVGIYGIVRHQYTDVGLFLGGEIDVIQDRAGKVEWQLFKNVFSRTNQAYDLFKRPHFSMAFRLYVLLHTHTWYQYIPYDIKLQISYQQGLSVSFTLSLPELTYA